MFAFSKVFSIILVLPLPLLYSEIIKVNPPISNNQLSNNPKNLANYLFCDDFPFENRALADLFQHLSISDYTKTLHSLTPEHYGALPIGESRIIQYLLTQNSTTWEAEDSTTAYVITASPLYYKDRFCKKCPMLPNYRQKRMGLRLQTTQNYTTPFQFQKAISYLASRTGWSSRLGEANSHAIYLDAKVSYKKNDFYSSISILGGYSRISTMHSLCINYPRKFHWLENILGTLTKSIFSFMKEPYEFRVIQAEAHPHLWDLALSLSFQHRYDYPFIALIPKVTLTQTNLFLSSIREDKPRDQRLKTEPKCFIFLDTLSSLRMEGPKGNRYINPYIDFGWHNIKNSNHKPFRSHLGNHAGIFTTQTYRGSSNAYFVEGGIVFSSENDMNLSFNSRTEVGKETFVQAINLGFDWRF